MKFSILFLTLAAVLSGCQTVSTDTTDHDTLEIYEFSELPNVEGTDLRLGGFSGLVFEGASQAYGHYDFTTLTDRGPNLDVRKDSSSTLLRPFVEPKFTPRFVSFSFNLKKRELSRVDETLMKRRDGSFMTGLPNVMGLDETPIDSKGHRIALDKMGVDTESLAKDPDDGTYWVGEEYRPSLLHFTKDAKLIERWIPRDTATGTGVPQLPKWYVRRRQNRGFEGVAVDGPRVVAFLQSPLEDEFEVTRILAVDKKTGEPQAEYAYAFEPADDGRPAVDKIGDAASLSPGRFLVIEQNDHGDDRGVHRIFEIDTTGATNLLPRNGAPLSRSVLCIEGMAATDCVRPVKKTLIVDLVALGLHGFDKVEGLAVLDAHTLALVNDNDFDVSKRKTPSALFIVHLARALDGLK